MAALAPAVAAMTVSRRRRPPMSQSRPWTMRAFAPPGAPRSAAAPAGRKPQLAAAVGMTVIATNMEARIEAETAMAMSE
jgi:hypothetical protein